MTSTDQESPTAARKRRRIRALVFAIVGALALLLFLVVSGPYDYDPRLTREARSGLVVIDALQRYRSEKGSFPADVAALRPYVPPCPADRKMWLWPEAICGWVYDSAPPGYTLWRRVLSHDPSLQYDFDGWSGRWVFNPGDGTPERVIVLRP